MSLMTETVCEQNTAVAQLHSSQVLDYGEEIQSM